MQQMNRNGLLSDTKLKKGFICTFRSKCRSAAHRRVATWIAIGSLHQGQASVIGSRLYPIESNCVANRRCPILSHLQGERSAGVQKFAYPLLLPYHFAQCAGDAWSACIHDQSRVTYTQTSRLEDFAKSEATLRSIPSGWRNVPFSFRPA